MRKLLLYGGSFDPVHLGHMSVASEVLEELDCDSIVMIPALKSPLKKHGPIASNYHRKEMLELAIEGYDRFEISSCELDRSGPSFTFDTVTFLKSFYGDDTKFYWLAGGDVIPELPYWHRISELLECCEMVLTYRAGFDMPDLDILKGQLDDSLIEKLDRNMVQTTLIHISSTIIRDRLAKGLDVSEYLDPKVRRYIEQNKLYRP